MNSIIDVLMKRDGFNRDEALELLNEARARVRGGENPEEILLEEFGLELDYIFDLI